MTNNQELTFRIILESPPPGVDYGLQKGGGNRLRGDAEAEIARTGDLQFEFSARVKEGKDGQPVLLGPFVHGPPQERFVYLDIGTYAGQTGHAMESPLEDPFSGNYVGRSEASVACKVLSRDACSRHSKRR